MNQRLLQALLRIAATPAVLMHEAGYTPDDWQEDFLHQATTRPGFRGLLCTCRQAGKSTSFGALGVWLALVRPKTDTIVVAPSQRQANELIRKAHTICERLGLPLIRDAATYLVLPTGGRIIALPGTGAVRGYTGNILADEGAWLADPVMHGVIMPMLSTLPGGGILAAASTPAGQRGWYYSWWATGGDLYQRWKVPWTECPRITPAYERTYRASVPAHVAAAELDCSFEASAGGVFRPTLIDAAFTREQTGLLLPDFTADAFDWGAEAAA
ncbi:terminase large subunit domain-containing protein [Streptoverticillium reticulum]|uniref:terminase large subunit domain-containing protein n=1 Tax=Streptoverticillium reticulum TaxID=1433415 RepID=UPI0039BED1E2